MTHLASTTPANRSIQTDGRQKSPQHFIWLIALHLLVLGGQPAIARALDSNSAIRELAETARELTGDGARESPPLEDSQRATLLDFRARLLREVDPSTLHDSSWIDLHLIEEAVARRLAPTPADEPGPGAGRELYEWRLRHWHQLDLSADDLILLGRTEIRRTLARLDGLALLSQTAGTPTQRWQELSAAARKDRPASADQLLTECRRLTLEAWKFTETSSFVSVPDVACELGVELGQSREDKPYAWYRPGKLEGRFYQGVYMVSPIPDSLSPDEQEVLLADLNLHWLRVISLHEAIPGHHLQFAVASLAESPVRKWGYNSVFVEGWGLYCEEALARHGYFDSLSAQVEQLRMRLWRAVRVLADAALHTGAMAREDAEELLVKIVLLDRDNARREVDRYLSSATQPMSYIVGQLMLEDIRGEAMQRGAAAFDERAFHDRMLSFGAIPISLLRAVLLDERQLIDRAAGWPAR